MIGGLRYHISHGRRPHILFGSHEMTRALPPIIIPPLQSVFFDKYSPSVGAMMTIYYCIILAHSLFYNYLFCQERLASPEMFDWFRN